MLTDFKIRYIVQDEVATRIKVVFSEGEYEDVETFRAGMDKPALERRYVRKRIIGTRKYTFTNNMNAVLEQDKGKDIDNFESPLEYVDWHSPDVLETEMRRFLALKIKEEFPNLMPIEAQRNG